MLTISHIYDFWEYLLKTSISKKNIILKHFFSVIPLVFHVYNNSLSDLFLKEKEDAFSLSTLVSSCRCDHACLLSENPFTLTVKCSCVVVDKWSTVDNETYLLLKCYYVGEKNRALYAINVNIRFCCLHLQFRYQQFVSGSRLLTLCSAIISEKKSIIDEGHVFEKLVKHTFLWPEKFSYYYF